MRKAIINNREICEVEIESLLNNRAFRYGDGLFESIKVFYKKEQFLNFHLERLLSGAYFLKFELPKNLLEELKKNVKATISNNQLNHGIIKIYLWRKAKGLYKPLTESVEYLITCVKSKKEKYELNKDGLRLSFYNSPTAIENNSLAEFKTTSQLGQVIAAKHCLEKGVDDCLIINNNNNISEAVSSNVFFIIKNTVYTPSLKSGCLNGIMRKRVLSLLKENKILFKKSLLSKDFIKSSSEIFLTNTSSGISWVKQLENISLNSNTLAKKLVKKINEQKK